MVNTAQASFLVSSEEKHLAVLIPRLSRAISGFSKNLGLGSSRSDGVLLLGTTLEPPKRLTSEAEGKSWLDGVVFAYAQRSGISLLVAPGSGDAAPRVQTFNVQRSSLTFFLV